VEVATILASKTVLSRYYVLSSTANLSCRKILLSINYRRLTISLRSRRKSAVLEFMECLNLLLLTFGLVKH